MRITILWIVTAFTMYSHKKYILRFINITICSEVLFIIGNIFLELMLKALSTKDLMLAMVRCVAVDLNWNINVRLIKDLLINNINNNNINKI